MSDFTPPTGINWRGDIGVVEYGNDRSMVAIFYNKPAHNPAKSVAEGHPHYEDQVFVRIHPPGERLNIVERRANEQDKRRFPSQWQQFQQENKVQQPEGAPIELLYPEYPSIAAMLRANAVLTIEQCADLSGPAINTVGMGAQRYVNEAKKWLEMAAKGRNASQMRHELEKRDREISTLTRTVEELKQTLEQVKNNAIAQPNLAQLQSLIAGAMQRPQQLPSYDTQEAMINATGKALRPAEKPRRQRPRITR